ncbi:hypothetical protein [Pseudoalteromonas byunsanensis]|uniref:Uncharacterized protein n=1 Tax=Pseudoalteromonas byunsanensis TaxID=327939 RepID=A0A1S1NA20_9GAMM|nr:hypothetical protein [Pseudoalteromonas byunsanensis]OHU96215.1 hypothetical protein BIW53_06625 [Pseudoalteromonas byunsanensis]
MKNKKKQEIASMPAWYVFILIVVVLCTADVMRSKDIEWFWIVAVTFIEGGGLSYAWFLFNKMIRK